MLMLLKPLPAASKQCLQFISNCTFWSASGTLRLIASTEQLEKSELHVPP